MRTAQRTKLLGGERFPATTLHKCPPHLSLPTAHVHTAKALCKCQMCNSAGCHMQGNALAVQLNHSYAANDLIQWFGCVFQLTGRTSANIFSSKSGCDTVRLSASAPQLNDQITRASLSISDCTADGPYYNHFWKK